MSKENTELRVTAKVKILKYAKGQAPKNADPFETVEREMMFFGADAERIIKEVGGAVNVTN